MTDLSAHFGNRYFKPNSGIELRAFTHGLMPVTVPRMLQNFTDDWKRYGVDAWNHIPNHWLPESGDSVGWWSLPEYLGDNFVAPLLSATVGSCIMQPNAHWSFNCVLSSEGLLDARKRIILSEGSFPSIQHSAKRWAEITGCDVVVVPLQADGQIDAEAVIEAIDERTSIVALSHVGFTTGALLPKNQASLIAEAVHDASGLFVIDGYHAAGSMEVDVAGLGCDVYIGGLLKESSGSSGNGFVYVKNSLDLNPRLSGWFGDADPFGFHDDPVPNPIVRRRFLGGTTAIASLYHAVEGVRILLDAGLKSVREDSIQKIAYCTERANSLDLKIRSPKNAAHQSSMFIIEIANASAFSERLKERGIFGDSRLDRFFRIAPFVWNSMDELELVWNEIKRTIVDSKSTGPVSRTVSGPVT